MGERDKGLPTPGRPTGEPRHVSAVDSGSSWAARVSIPARGECFDNDQVALSAP